MQIKGKNIGKYHGVRSEISPQKAYYKVLCCCHRWATICALDILTASRNGKRDVNKFHRTH